MPSGPRADIAVRVKDLLQRARASGAPQVAVVAQSEDFVDPERRAAIPRAVEAHRAKMRALIAAIDEALGPGRDEDGDVLAAREWTPRGACVRLELDHPDRELPVTITLRVEAETVDRAPGAKPSAQCACAELLAFDGYEDPFGAHRALREIFERVEPTLTRIARTKTARGKTLRLYRCAACGTHLQSAGLSPECVFPVDAISVEDWQTDPYASPIDLAMHDAAVRRYYDLVDRTTTTDRCRREGCSAFALKDSVFCIDHHTAGLPTPPAGRISRLCRRRP